MKMKWSWMKVPLPQPWSGLWPLGVANHHDKDVQICRSDVGEEGVFLALELENDYYTLHLVIILAQCPESCQLENVKLGLNSNLHEFQQLFILWRPLLRCMSFNNFSSSGGHSDPNTQSILLTMNDAGGGWGRSDGGHLPNLNSIVNITSQIMLRRRTHTWRKPGLRRSCRVCPRSWWTRRSPYSSGKCAAPGTRIMNSPIINCTQSVWSIWVARKKEATSRYDILKRENLLSFSLQRNHKQTFDS